MAIRELKGRASPYQVYWNNPFTGKRESACFATKEEAEKENSLIKHRLKFERESFRPENMEDTQEEEQELTLEQAYFLYLKEKQFNKKYLEFQLLAMRPILAKCASFLLSLINRDFCCQFLNMFQQSGTSSATVHHKMSVLRSFLRWCTEKEMLPAIAFPKLPAKNYKKFIPPSPQEIELMLQAASDHIKRVTTVRLIFKLIKVPLNWYHKNFWAYLVFVSVYPQWF